MPLGTVGDELYKNDPDARPLGEPVEDSVVGDEDEQRLQRAAMERQLRSQSSALDQKGLHGQHSVPGAAPTAVSEQERVRGETLTEEQLLSYRGKPLLDADGEEIGPISCVYRDEATGIPKWLGVQLGTLMGSQRVVAPVFGSYSFRDAISVPYARKVILEAEVATAGAITPEQDSGLYLHFGIPVSTERSLSGLPAGMDPTRVKRSERWLHTPLARNVRHVGGRALGVVGRWRWPWTHAA
jgi:hypothetical protein